MDKKIDVLAVMDAEIAALHSEGGAGVAVHALTEARAAMAALIERADYLCRTGEGMIAFRAALARVRSS